MLNLLAGPLEFLEQDPAEVDGERDEFQEGYDGAADGQAHPPAHFR